MKRWKQYGVITLSIFIMAVGVYFFKFPNHFCFGGVTGALHGLDFDIVDEYAAYVVPAKLAAVTIIDLLYDGASLAQEIRRGFTPQFAGKEEYLAFARSTAD